MVNDIVELSIGGKSVKIEDILSLSFSDSAGVKSDKVSLKVMPYFPKPKPSTKLELTFKTLKNGSELESLECGLFHVQTVTRSNTKELSFSATGVEFNEKQKKNSLHRRGRNKRRTASSISQRDRKRNG